MDEAYAFAAFVFGLAIGSGVLVLSYGFTDINLERDCMRENNVYNCVEIPATYIPAEDKK